MPTFEEKLALHYDERVIHSKNYTLVNGSPKDAKVTSFEEVDERACPCEIKGIRVIRRYHGNFSILTFDYEGVEVEGVKPTGLMDKVGNYVMVSKVNMGEYLPFYAYDNIEEKMVVSNFAIKVADRDIYSIKSESFDQVMLDQIKDLIIPVQLWAIKQLSKAKQLDLEYKVLKSQLEEYEKQKAQEQLGAMKMMRKLLGEEE